MKRSTSKGEISNLLSGIPTLLPEELVTSLARSGEVRIERIVSKGHVTAEGFWYDQEMTEFVLLVQGEAKLEFEDQEGVVDLRAGDYLVIPAHRRHRVDWTHLEKETVWLAVYY